MQSVSRSTHNFVWIRLPLLVSQSDLYSWNNPESNLLANINVSKSLLAAKNAVLCHFSFCGISPEYLKKKSHVWLPIIMLISPQHDYTLDEKVVLAKNGHGRVAATQMVPLRSAADFLTNCLFGFLMERLSMFLQ